MTIGWDRWRTHRAAGRDERTFTVGYTTNDVWNYFWNRRPPGAPQTHAESVVDRQSSVVGDSLRLTTDD
jgi:hypothetical protein